ncbi:NAD-glutamate dehydrogenase [Vibrio chagasii]|nr:NAD-glutamate dehydrogenase [Vibrio chagasii]
MLKVVFVCKRQHMMSGRDEIFAEGQRCYKRFIRALLRCIEQQHHRRRGASLEAVHPDEDDPYLVVAADKGTATFSDLANSVS